MSGETCANENRCDGSDAVPPSAIIVDASQGIVQSNLSDASHATPQNTLSLLTPENMVLPLTPLCRVMEMPSEAILEEVYDRDMQFGPFIQYGLLEEQFASIDEVEKTVIEVVTAEPCKSEEGEAVPVLTSDDIKKMKVTELRNSLQARGMTKNVLKVVLVSRLDEAVDKNVSLMQSCAPVDIEYRDGCEFAAGAYQKKIDQEAEVIYQEVNVDGIRFLGTAVPAVEHENNMFKD